MGWSFEICERSRKDFIASLTGPKHFGEDYTPLASRVVGNNVWQLVHQKSVGRTFICLDLIAKERGGGWGYKGLSEDMGPCEVNCPLSLLDKASESTTEYGTAWRERVRSYHAAKKARPVWAPGMQIEYGEHRYKLEQVSWRGARFGWSAVQLETGGRYRITARQLSKSKEVQP